MNENEVNQMRTVMKSELEPLFDGIRRKPKESLALFKQSFADFKKRVIQATYILELIGLKGAEESRGSFISAVYNLFAYLGIVESLGNIIVDMVVMLLVANGRDFHIERLHGTPKVKHAIIIKDLEEEKVPLTTKLNFLKDNGLQKLAGIIDSKLRNDIAHFKFGVQKEKICVRGKPVDAFIMASLNELIYALDYVLELFIEFDKELSLTTKRE